MSTDDAHRLSDPDPSATGDIVIVTGRAGAGRTTAINALEDVGFERVDRPPLGFVAQIVGELLQGGRDRIVIGVDAKTAGFSAPALMSLRDQLQERLGRRPRIVFLDGSDEALRRRYTETRRRHPLSPSGSVDDGMRVERGMTDSVRSEADIVIDTSALAPSELKRVVLERLVGADAPSLTVSVASFAYRNGLPAEADLVFDCRFLRNPHYEPDLRDRDGRSPDVASFVAEDPLYTPFFERVADLVRLLLPAFRREGKSYLTIAFGCTGGKHRSVALAEALGAALRRDGVAASVRHRDRPGSPRG